MPIRISNMSIEFINAMVQAMYSYEAKQVLCLDLLNKQEMNDFYQAYLGGPI